MEILDSPLGFQSWLGSHLAHKGKVRQQNNNYNKSNKEVLFFFPSTQTETERLVYYSQGAEDCGVDLVKLDPNRMDISLIFSRSPFSSASK